MKTIILLFALFPAISFAQKVGKWKIDGVVIERKDSIQIEHTPVGIDTLAVKWLSEASYSLVSRSNPPLMVHITKVTKDGYFGLVTDGNRVKRFRADLIWR